MAIPAEIPGEIADLMEAASNEEADVFMLQRGVEPADLPTARLTDTWAIVFQAATHKYYSLWAIQHTPASN